MTTPKEPARDAAQGGGGIVIAHWAVMYAVAAIAYQHDTENYPLIAPKQRARAVSCWDAAVRAGMVLQ